MSEFKIGVFCNGGTHFTEVLCAARRKYPAAALCAFLRRDFEVTPTISSMVDTIRRIERDDYSIADAGAVGRLIRGIRNERFDLFIVLFDSVQLNVLGGISGARNVECWDSANVIHPLPHSIAGVLLRLLGSRVYGFVRCWVIEAVIRTTQRKGLDFRAKEASSSESSLPE